MAPTQKKTSDKIIVASSILSADFARLGEEIEDVRKGGCDWIHVDVMDGHFVPNLTIGPPVIRKIRKVTRLPLDVHLMIERPVETVQEYAEAGADFITVHVEACDDVRQTLDVIRQLGKSVGLTLKPRTPVETVLPYVEYVDLILVMTVEPGFGGQAFMPEPVKKIERLRKEGFGGYISVDGGIAPETAKVCREAGAQVFVAGNAIFSRQDRRQIIQALKAV